MEEKQVRGFSYRPETDVDLQYVLGDELKSMWAASKRERTKIQESKIWDEFCKERDVVSQVMEDDPYQFLEDYNARDLLIGYAKSAELKKNVPKENVVTFGSGEPYPAAKKTVNFHGIAINPAVKENYQIERRAVESRPYITPFNKSETIPNIEEEVTSHVYEKQSNFDLAANPQDGSKVETPNDSECNDEVILTTSESELSNQRNVKLAKHAAKPEMLHNIYYIRLKEHRKKILETLQCILLLLQTQEYEMEDPLQVYKLEKRSSEFSARFTRTHMYQLRTQLQDLKRSMKMSLPFGKRTLFQTQMPKVVSLHQNSLQALQVFAKSLESAPCLSDCGHHLSAILQSLKETTVSCVELITSTLDDAKESAEQICNDGILILCDQVEDELTHFTEKMVLTARLASTRSSMKSQRNKSANPYEKKSSVNNAKRTGFKELHCIDSGLSMYSAKVRSSNDSSKTSAVRRISVVPATQPKVSDAKRQVHSRSAPGQPKKVEEPEVKRSPGYGRKPLMRNPDKGKHCVKRQKQKDDDIKTMVETQPIVESPNVVRQQEVTQTPVVSPHKQKPEKKSAQDERAALQVERLLHRLCEERPANARTKPSGVRNARLICVQETSPKQMLTTPSLLKILEESIQKKPTKSEVAYQLEFQTLPEDVRNKLLLSFNLPEAVQAKYMEYRKNFAQHMICSPMYANTAIDRPWEAIARTSDVIMDEILLGLTKEMNFEEDLQQMYALETK